MPSLPCLIVDHFVAVVCRRFHQVGSGTRSEVRGFSSVLVPRTSNLSENAFRQKRQPPDDVGSQVQAQDPPSPGGEGLPVAQGLGRLEGPEGNGGRRPAWLVGDRDILYVVCRDLDEKPPSAVALVELPRRVEEAGAVTPRCRGPVSGRVPPCARPAAEGPLRRAL